MKQPTLPSQHHRTRIRHRDAGGQFAAPPSDQRKPARQRKPEPILGGDTAASGPGDLNNGDPFGGVYPGEEVCDE